MNSDSPLVCNMNVFTPAQRDSHIQTTMELIQAVESVQGVENGYELRFPNQTEFIAKIAEFISNERLCCPFLKFSLTVASNNEPVSLSLTGPMGTQEFLRGEFAGAIP
jgi:hypothetical protein